MTFKKNSRSCEFLMVILVDTEALDKCGDDSLNIYTFLNRCTS